MPGSFPEDWEFQACSACGQPMAVTGTPPLVLYECITSGCPGGDPVPFEQCTDADRDWESQRRDLPEIPRRHAIEHYKRHGTILPGHTGTIAAYRAQNTPSEDGDRDD